MIRLKFLDKLSSITFPVKVIVIGTKMVKSTSRYDLTYLKITFSYQYLR